MPRPVRLVMNVARVGICAICLFVLFSILHIIYDPKDTETHTQVQSHNKKLPVYIERKSSLLKDAVFDPQALRAADPSRHKVLQVGEHNPYLAPEGTGPRRHPMIPHILHQVWDSEDTVPRRFVPWLETWAKHNRMNGAGGDTGQEGPVRGGGSSGGWEHWIWSPKAVLCLLERHYPDHVNMYQDYPDDVSRADAMRYFVLHRYGGVYADLDTESLASLDPWTYQHQCILSEEPYAHSYLVREANRSNIVNSPMACRPRHPFFAAAIDALPEFAGRYFGDFLRSTGPQFLDAVFQSYQEHDPQDNITVVPPRYFLPTYDPSQTGIVDTKCTMSSTYINLPPRQKQVCDLLMERDFKNSPYPDSFMDHHWVHVNMMDPSWKVKDTVPWTEVVPKVKKMSLSVCHGV